MFIIFYLSVSFIFFIFIVCSFILLLLLHFCFILQPSFKQVHNIFFSAFFTPIYICYVLFIRVAILCIHSLNMHTFACTLPRSVRTPSRSPCRMTFFLTYVFHVTSFLQIKFISSLTEQLYFIIIHASLLLLLHKNLFPIYHIYIFTQILSLLVL